MKIGGEGDFARSGGRGSYGLAGALVIPIESLAAASQPITSTASRALGKNCTSLDFLTQRGDPFVFLS